MAQPRHASGSSPHAWMWMATRRSPVGCACSLLALACHLKPRLCRHRHGHADSWCLATSHCLLHLGHSNCAASLVLRDRARGWESQWGVTVGCTTGGEHVGQGMQRGLTLCRAYDAGPAHHQRSLHALILLLGCAALLSLVISAPGRGRVRFRMVSGQESASAQTHV